MLKHLYVRNYALISHLDIDFQEGFAVMTGETGAGKSIILGALNLVMGARADTKTITEGEDKCVIEATFQTENNDGTIGDELIIRRELNQNGRSRSFVNDEVVTQAELKQLARELIDIHSQHESLLIGDDLFQIQVVDAIANNTVERDAYNAAYVSYLQADTALRDAESLAKKMQADADYMQWQYQQLDEANLMAGELADLEEEEYQLSHAEDIKMSLQNALEKIDNDQVGAIAQLRDVRLQDASTQMAERVDSVLIELQDICRDLNRMFDRIEMNPERLAHVQERISLLQTLMKKHHVTTVEELISLRDDLGQHVQRIANMDEELSEKQRQKAQCLLELQKAAEILTQTRLEVREKIANNLMVNMKKLGVVHANVAVNIVPADDFTATGKDVVQLMFAANLNQSLRAVADVASGGEISRLMLCIKSLIASVNGLSTIIFDEIDTGVSGEIASQMGEIMRQIAQARQVIAITHLPQVAAKSEQHYWVYKEDTETRTETHIRLLTAQEHAEEIEKMRKI
jgi:DNA repair protein RecN (Recombination protein N)